MAKEMLVFPEEKIPDVVAVIRAGLAARGDEIPDVVREQLTQQCDDLEEYWNRCGEEDDT